MLTKSRRAFVIWLHSNHEITTQWLEKQKWQYHTSGKMGRTFNSQVIKQEAKLILVNFCMVVQGKCFWPQSSFVTLHAGLEARGENFLKQQCICPFAESSMCILNTMHTVLVDFWSQAPVCQIYATANASSHIGSVFAEHTRNFALRPLCCGQH